ncbi:hypothetical protein [Paenibacillus harenae]|uniref:Uncharacterized protein n=1 Tax=Paenibacillus harenae TaxID=306543 RepID=A0ABT9TV49_PAEHA|nr:hypothetical protein [Paenibacillus harenae]MDQ0111247.1 hypothetical protein [Paenibacillus harenae]
MKAIMADIVKGRLIFTYKREQFAGKVQRKQILERIEQIYYFSLSQRFSDLVNETKAERPEEASQETNETNITSLLCLQATLRQH